MQEGDVVSFNRSGYNVIKDKKDYLDKRDILFRMLSQPGLDTESKAAAKERLATLDLAARNAGIIKEDQDANPMAQAVTRRIVNQHPEWIVKYGVEALMQTIDDVAEGEGDFEEIGSSDISAYVQYVKDALDDRMGSREEMDDRRPFAESAATTEDVISSVKKKLGDYLSDLTKEIKKDPDLKDKLERDIDQIGPAVKTLKTDDGHEIKIHGNEDDGFRITIKNQESKAKFKNLDEATMAVEMYCARRRGQMENADYIEEKNHDPRRNFWSTQTQRHAHLSP